MDNASRKFVLTGEHKCLSHYFSLVAACLMGKLENCFYFAPLELFLFVIKYTSLKECHRCLGSSSTVYVPYSILTKLRTNLF